MSRTDEVLSVLVILAVLQVSVRREAVVVREVRLNHISQEEPVGVVVVGWVENEVYRSNRKQALQS